MRSMGFDTISEQTILDGLAKARHPGRLEFFDGFLLDGAHNISGAKVLRSFLDKQGFSRRVFIFGAMKGKDIGDMLLHLLDRNSLILTVPVDSPRSRDSGELAEIAAEIVGRDMVQRCTSLSDAIARVRRVKEDGWNEDGDIVCVTGSLYLIGEFKRAMDMHQG